MTTPPFPAPTTAELAVVSAQLGRTARGVVGIAARCECGNPTVVATTPRLPDGTPFPTFYYLTHPAATAAISTLEATQVMPELSALLAEDEGVAAAYLAAHEAYLATGRSSARSARSMGSPPAACRRASSACMLWPVTLSRQVPA